MRDQPPGTTLFLLLAIAGGLWGISHLLDDPSRTRALLPSGDRLRTANLEREAQPPTHRLPHWDGNVKDPQGRPVDGALVELGGQMVRTSASGEFRLARTPGNLRISRKGFFPLILRPDLYGSVVEQGGEFVIFRGRSFTGRVVRSSGEPIAGVDVITRQMPEGPPRQTVTDVDGRWHSHLFRRGHVHILFRHPDYQVTDRTLSTLEGRLSARGKTGALTSADTTRTEIGDIRLETGTPLEIHTMDERERPLAHCQVWLELLPRPGESTGLSTRYLGLTGDLGELRTRRPPDREARIRVQLAGFRPARADVRQQDMRIELRAGPTLRAQAITLSGLPRRPRRVDLEVLSEGSFRPAPHRGLLFHSLADGKMRIGLPPLAGTYRLAVQAEDQLFGVSDLIEFDGYRSPSFTLVRLRPQLVLQGIVYSDEGPAVDAVVSLLEASGQGAGQEAGGDFASERVLYRVHSATDGRFAFSVVPRGLCRIAVEHPGFANYYSAAIPLPISASREYPIVLSKGSIVEGIVLAPGDSEEDGAPDIPVVLQLPRMPARTTWTDREGRFRFENVPPAREVVLVIDEHERSHSTRREARLEIKPDRIVKVELRAAANSRGSLEGRILLDGRPLRCDSRLISLQTRFDRRTSTDGDGRFLERSLPAGDYRIEGITLPFSRVVRVESGQRKHLEISVETLSVQLDIVSGSGNSVPGDGIAELRPYGLLLPGAARGGIGGEASNASQSQSQRYRAKIALSRASFEGIYPGTYRLLVRMPGFVLYEKLLDITEGGTRRIRLVRGKGINLTLLTDDGSPLRGDAEIVVLQRDRWVHREHRRVDGKVEIPPLAPGQYTIIVRSGSHNYRHKVVIPDTAAK